jgi:alkaline phosphatase D
MRISIAFVFSFLFVGLSWSQLNRQVVPEPCMEPFYHGVASGDPLHDRVIIWTRVTPESEVPAPVLVSWRMATDTAMTQNILSGSVITNDEKDYTVKIDVTGLQPDTWYFYEFTTSGKRSIQGRTRTTPLPGTMKDSLRFAVVSCANFEAGFFNAYGSLVNRRDFDAVLCLGDYIYEYETGGYSPNPATNRQVEPLHEIISLEDYRMRYAIYRLDPDLRRLHQLMPWFCIWDDHESANDAWIGGAENHDASEGDWTQRKNASKQAYFEWLPIRENPATPQYSIYRSVSYGQLADVILLDTRLEGRVEQVAVTSSNLNNPSRTLLGNTQFNWLLNQLTQSQATYKLVAQQVMMAPLKILGVAVNMDQWDGYPAERQQLLNHVLAEDVKNMVVLTGDIHTSWANEIPTSTVRAGVEFVGPSVTSPGLNLGSGVGESTVLLSNSHIKWVNLSQKGYMIVDVNQNRVQSDWYFVQTIDEQNPAHFWGNSYYANQGVSQLIQTSTVSTGRDDLFTDVPLVCPRPIQPVNPDPASIDEHQLVIMGVYPNPVMEVLTIQFSQLEVGNVIFRLIDASGKLVYTEQFTTNQGSWIHQINTSGLSAGMFVLEIETGGKVFKRKIVKE